MLPLETKHCASIRDKSINHVVRIIRNTGVLMWTKLGKAALNLIIDICLCDCQSIRPPAKKNSLPLNAFL